eukprot:TRINITY_DN8746_c0_g1_i1.p1 TRINITY_DN8746_c0_g1~~TRINITY_DN8746_c0_g1_i1.p1  ORF type:complete len:292 (+),score=49.89 TRINITY_DN8746_c0_g1_i1:68-877(+)
MADCAQQSSDESTNDFFADESSQSSLEIFNEDAGKEEDCLGAFNDVRLAFVDEGRSMTVSSHMLAFSSPVFRAMLKSCMVEGNTKCVEVREEIGTIEEFKQFYSFLLPPTDSAAVLDKDNVNGVLAFSAYYQVDRLKRACERFLLAEVDASAQGLLQAERFGLREWRAKCMDELVEAYDYDALSALSDHPHLLLEVTQRMLPTCCKLVKPCRELVAMRSRLQSAKEDAWNTIPETERRGNYQRVDKFVTEGIADVLSIVDSMSNAMPQQ